MRQETGYSDLLNSYLKVINIKIDIDSILNEIDADILEIESRYLPRNRFNRWRDSQDGKTWKEQKWKSQGCRCAECQNEIPLLGSHIDHIQPLSKYPELALDTKNLRVTCFSCNTSKGNRE